MLCNGQRPIQEALLRSYLPYLLGQDFMMKLEFSE